MMLQLYLFAMIGFNIRCPTSKIPLLSHFDIEYHKIQDFKTDKNTSVDHGVPYFLIVI